MSDAPPTVQLRQADEQRRAAMFTRDVEALDRLLASDITWIHSSGATESKAQFIDAIRNFLSVWRAEQGGLRLLAWQSTNFSD